MESESVIFSHSSAFLVPGPYLSFINTLPPFATCQINAYVLCRPALKEDPELIFSCSKLTSITYQDKAATISSYLLARAEVQLLNCIQGHLPAPLM